MKLIYILIPILFLFISCEKEIPLSENDIAPRVVINSVFSPDSTWRVNLSESRPLLSTDNLPNIENASVRLMSSGGSILGTFTYELNGNYILSTPLPNISSTYSLEVSAPGFEIASATSSCPKLAEIISIDTFLSKNDYSMNFNIKFQDEKNIKNYYSIKITTSNYWIDYETEDTSFVDYQGFSTTEPYVVNGSSDLLSTNDLYANQFYFSDDIMDGNLINFRAKTNYIDPILGGVYKITVTSLSEEAYKYFVSLDRYYQADGDFFAEPVQVISNVENGLGIFGGQTINQKIIMVE